MAPRHSSETTVPYCRISCIACACSDRVGGRRRRDGVRGLRKPGQYAATVWRAMPDPALFARSCLVPAARPPCAHSSAPSAYFSGFNLPDWKEASGQEYTDRTRSCRQRSCRWRAPAIRLSRRHDPCPILHPRHRLRPRRSAAPAGPHDGHAGRLDGNIHRRPAPAPPVPAGRPQPAFQAAALSVIAQGTKLLLVGDEAYEYDPSTT